MIDEDERKPTLFYYEDALDAWVPAPEKVENMIDARDHFSDDGEVITIQFKRIDISEREIQELPEG
jgi:predicted RNA-binding protein